MSALDARIRLIAREEAAALTGASPAAVAPADGSSEVTELRSLVEQLAARVEALEKPAARRSSTRSKSAESGE